MAVSSSTLLTKYIDSTTIITASVANMWFGGLFGSIEGASCAAGDPLIAGHAHDGLNQDGHAQKIDLVDHVTGELRNSNLADEAVIARNIQSFLDQGSAIPEFEIISGTTYYYLDLSDIRAQIANNGALITTSNVTSNTPGTLATDDFVFGSSDLDDDNDFAHDSRFMFDKSKGSFRAGVATEDQWDDLNRGIESVAFGSNNIAAGANSVVSGGSGNEVSSSSPRGFIGGGIDNIIETSIEGIIVGGSDNSMSDSFGSFIGGGNSNTLDTDGSEGGSFIGAGTGNTISGDGNSVVINGGKDNSIEDSSYAVIVGGTGNSIDGAPRGLISGGDGNILTATNNGNGYSAIVGGKDNIIDAADTEANFSSILGGEGNIIRSSVLASSSYTADHSSIGGGDTNLIEDADYAFISGGYKNRISAPETGFSNGSFSVIRGGGLNSVEPGGIFSDVGGHGGRGYMRGQHVIGGGYWAVDLDVDGFPSPAGQAQTSTIIASGTITSASTFTTLFTDIVASSGGLVVPEESCVFCEVTFIVRDSATAALVSGGKYSATLRRDVGVSAAAVVDSSTTLTFSSDGMTSDFSLVPALMGSVAPRGLVGGGSTTMPARFVAKISWTQVYFSN